MKKLLWLLLLLPLLSQAQVIFPNLPSGSTPIGSDTTICNQPETIISPTGGTNKCTFSQILTYISANISGALRIASGQSVLATSAISSGTCATVVSTTATGVLATDSVNWSFSADPTSTTGYIPSTSGMLTIISYPTANAVNWKVCNNTSSSITPGAVTLNWQVTR
jgi:hypothetical protein